MKSRTERWKDHQASNTKREIKWERGKRQRKVGQCSNLNTIWVKSKKYYPTALLKDSTGIQARGTLPYPLLSHSLLEVWSAGPHLRIYHHNYHSTQRPGGERTTSWGRHTSTASINHDSPNIWGTLNRIKGEQDEQRGEKHMCVGGGGGGRCSNTQTGKTKHQVSYLYHKAEEIFPLKGREIYLTSKVKENTHIDG